MLDRLFPPKRIALPNGKAVMEKRSRIPLIGAGLALCTIASVYFTDFRLQTLIGRIDQFWVIVSDMLPPDWSSLGQLWPPLLDTVKMSLLGSIAGALLALPAAVMAASNIVRSKPVAAAGKAALSLLRTLPTLVTALIATFVFGLGPLAGTAAIMLFTLSYVGKLLCEQIENADMGPFEAMESLGMTRMQAFRFAVLPQVLPGYISTSLFCFEGNVRYAAILGYVGAGGIGLLINENLAWRDYPRVGMIIVALIVTVYLIETVSEHFRKKLI
ncbi:phosphonate ABC transporter, permease protein PhnE [Paenibacillus ginsengihumi]|uniref:phosphonate ABC transporter, permease protein PhnE n=1 Tax=Paenibacillus ginsengihumi TaxID=431596 RepID=UPI0003635454|nr:phosphonate ABC transporter, permease protein PhnE [Paenibacillus ginsengihumi]